MVSALSTQTPMVTVNDTKLLMDDRNKCKEEMTLVARVSLAVAYIFAVVATDAHPLTSLALLGCLSLHTATSLLGAGAIVGGVALIVDSLFTGNLILFGLGAFGIYVGHAFLEDLNALHSPGLLEPGIRYLANQAADLFVGVKV